MPLYTLLLFSLGFLVPGGPVCYWRNTCLGASVGKCVPHHTILGASFQSSFKTHSHPPHLEDGRGKLTSFRVPFWLVWATLSLKGKSREQVWFVCWTGWSLLLQQAIRRAVSFLLPIWVASSVRQNEVGKSHCWLLLSEQLWLNKFLHDLRRSLSPGSQHPWASGCRIIQIPSHHGVHTCSGFSTLRGPSSVTAHHLGMTPPSCFLLLFSPQPFCFPPG